MISSKNVNVEITVDTKDLQSAVSKWLVDAISKYAKANAQLTQSMRGLGKSMVGFHSGGMYHGAGRSVSKPIDVKTLKELTAKLNRSEKTVLRHKGLHPTKNRTYNLVNYIEDMTDEEIELLVQLISEGEAWEIHAGMVPFVNRNYALNVIYRNTKVSTNDVRGYKYDTIIMDDVTAGKIDFKAEKLKSKQKLVGRKC